MKSKTATPLTEDQQRAQPALELVELGRVAKKPHDQRSPREKGVYDVAVKRWGFLIVARAVAAHDAHDQEQQARERGGTIVSERIQSRNGERRVVARSVQHFPPKSSPASATPSQQGRPRSAPRARGAGRPKAQSTRSSAKSGDSGEDSDSSEPPPAGRLCECGCGASIDHLAPHAHSLNDTHSKRARRAAARQDRLEDHLDRHRHDPYLDLERHELERLRKRVEDGCRCNGHHIPDETGDGCTKCGHWRGARTAKWVSQDTPLRAQSFVSTHAPKRKSPRLGDRKRKPVTDGHGKRITVPKPERMAA